MKKLCNCILFALLVLASPDLGRADELTDRVDRLFGRWDKDDSPGCAIAVVKDNQIVHEKTYGLADLEQATRIRSNTVFHVASVSKHFTSFALLLLEKDGKLSLDDDVRKYLPELHDFGKPITLRHLLQHTSELRDQWGLLMLARWRIDDVITDNDILRLVWRQRELNHVPANPLPTPLPQLLPASHNSPPTQSVFSDQSAWWCNHCTRHQGISAYQTPSHERSERRGARTSQRSP